MRDHKVLLKVAALRFGATEQLHPLNPTLKSNPSIIVARAIAGRGAFLAN